MKKKITIFLNYLLGSPSCKVDSEKKKLIAIAISIVLTAGKTWWFKRGNWMTEWLVGLQWAVWWDWMRTAWEAGEEGERQRWGKSGGLLALIQNHEVQFSGELPVGGWLTWQLMFSGSCPHLLVILDRASKYKTRTSTWWNALISGFAKGILGISSCTKPQLILRELIQKCLQDYKLGAI